MSLQVWLLSVKDIQNLYNSPLKITNSVTLIFNDEVIE